VLFPFPFTDLTSRKLRPCLVISNEMGDDIILCQITSKKVKKDRYCVEVKKNDTTGGSLQIDSYVRANMIFTASRKQVPRKVCVINDRKYRQVVRNIYDIIDKKTKDDEEFRTHEEVGRELGFR
jgi:mRNA interferase MazF